MNYERKRNINSGFIKTVIMKMITYQLSNLLSHVTVVLVISYFIHVVMPFILHLSYDKSRTLYMLL